MNPYILSDGAQIELSASDVMAIIVQFMRDNHLRTIMRHADALDTYNTNHQRCTLHDGRFVSDLPTAKHYSNDGE